MKKYFFAFFILLLPAISVDAQQQADTVIAGIHYNTIIYYQNFQYKPTQSECTVIAYGTITAGVKTGYWRYVSKSGDVLAEGKYRDGFKKGNWDYWPPAMSPVRIHWKKSDHADSYIAFYDNTEINIIDFDKKTKYQLKINGGQLPEHPVRFL